MYDDELNYKMSEDFDDDEILLKKEKSAKDIFESEIYEPELLIFCKDDRKSFELLQFYSKLAIQNNYEAILSHKVIFEENSENEVKSIFIRNFYTVNYSYKIGNCVISETSARRITEALLRSQQNIQILSTLL